MRDRHGITSEFDAKYAFYDLGYNLRPTEITGFLGILQLKYLESNIQKRLSNFLEIESVITSNSDFVPLNHSHIERLSPFAMPFICRSPELKTNYLNRFAKAGIEVRPMIAGNLTKQPFYLKYIGDSYSAELDSTDFIDTCGFYCGNYPELEARDLNLIHSCII